MMDDQSDLNYVSRGLSQKVAHALLQALAELSLRFDPDKFSFCFSMLSEGSRIDAQLWALGPGWLGSDCQPGRPQ